MFVSMLVEEPGGHTSVGPVDHLRWFNQQLVHVMCCNFKMIHKPPCIYKLRYCHVIFNYFSCPFNSTIGKLVLLWGKK